MINRLIIWGGMLIFIAAQKCNGQNFPNLQFDHISVKDGLSSNSVTSIAEDKLGFIWIGTSNGLNRYDGYRFKHYYHSNNDSNSLVNNDVQRLYCDSKGRIWISTEDGLSCFIPSADRFINFSTRNKSPYHLKNNSSVGVYEDASGNVWLTNQLDVIYRVLPDLRLQDVVIHLPGFTFYNLSLSGYDKIFRDRAGTEWAFRANRVYQLNKLTKQVEKTFDLSPKINGFILKILSDSAGRYFVVTYNYGIWLFIPDKNILQQVETIFPPRIFSDITEWDYKGRKWINILEVNLGFCLLNPTNLSSKKYIFMPGDPSSLQGNNFSQCYIDKKNNLWIASNQGINKISAEQNIFDVIPVTDPGSRNYDILTSAPVYAIYETDSSLWISKRGVSTIEYSSDFIIKKYYGRLFPLSSSLVFSTCGYAYSFFQKQNELFITTDSGLVIYDLIKKSSRVFFPDSLQANPDLRTIIPFSNDELLVRSYSYGLFVFNTIKKKFTKRFLNSDFCNDCLPLRINYLFKTKNNEIFVSTSSNAKGLFKYDNGSASFEQVNPVNNEKYPMQASDLYGMDEDKQGNLWITSKSGLFIYNPASNEIVQQNNDNEQIGSLSRICFDNYGNAWANGSSGIWCYLSKKKKWISFNGQDGLPGSEFEGMISKKRNGDIVAGLEGAIAIFHPDKLTEQFNGSPVIITEASVANKLTPFSLVNDAEKKLTLSPGQNFFSADFAILNYLNPASSRYYYKLSPVMKDFQLNDNGHVNFNGLSPGHYTLYVKAGDKAGNIFDKEDILKIMVEPKWFQTDLFKAGCLLFLGGIIFYFVRRRIKTVRKEASFKQKISETEMQALRAQMNPHFIFNSLNSIENFIMQNEKRLASDYLNKFSRLIRSILDSSMDEVVPVAKDMEVLKLYTDLEQLRFNNKFSCHIYTDPQLMQGDYVVPSLLIQPYVENAIVHGIAHSHREQLELSVTAVLEGGNIKYTIQDNGVGRIKAGEYNRQNKPRHKSVGLQITAERIAHFNNDEQTNAVKVIDLYNDDHEPCGTKVEILLKAG